MAASYVNREPTQPLAVNRNVRRARTTAARQWYEYTSSHRERPTASIWNPRRLKTSLLLRTGSVRKAPSWMRLPCSLRYWITATGGRSVLPSFRKLTESRPALSPLHTPTPGSPLPGVILPLCYRPPHSTTVLNLSNENGAVSRSGIHCATVDVVQFSPATWLSF